MCRVDPKHRVIVAASGGLDSTVLVCKLLDDDWTVDMLALNYGQRHARELEAAEQVARRLRCRLDVVDVSGVGRLLQSSALTGPASVPEGHYAAPNMAVTVVPNRNAIFLTVAYAVAAERCARAVATAIHAGDHAIYSDCRPEFAAAFEAMEREALAGVASPIRLLTPFIGITKAEIVALGNTLHAPFDLTWSCYNGRAKHCGKCGTCVERREAFALAGVSDPTEYE